MFNLHIILINSLCLLDRTFRIYLHKAVLKGFATIETKDFGKDCLTCICYISIYAFSPSDCLLKEIFVKPESPANLYPRKIQNSFSQIIAAPSNYNAIRLI